MLRHGVLAALAQADGIGGAGLAAEQPRRAEAPMLHEERCLSLASQNFHAIAHAEAAAELAGAARALAQRIGFEQDRVALLQDFDRLRLRDADGRATVADAVPGPPAAVPAAREEVHDVV